MAEPAIDPYNPQYLRVSRQISEYIIENDLPPGSRMLTEMNLAEKFNVSKTVMREALKTLAAVGRIVVRKGSGIFVGEDIGLLAPVVFNSFTGDKLSQIDNLFEFRMTIEAAAASLAASKALPPAIAAIRISLEEMEDFRFENDRSQFLDLYEKFHLSIAKAGGNQLFFDCTKVIYFYTRKIVEISSDEDFRSNTERIISEIRDIFSAIQSGMPELAATLTSANIKKSQEIFNRELKAQVRIL